MQPNLYIYAYVQTHTHGQTRITCRHTDALLLTVFVEKNADQSNSIDFFCFVREVSTDKAQKKHSFFKSWWWTWPYIRLPINLLSDCHFTSKLFTPSLVCNPCWFMLMTRTCWLLLFYSSRPRLGLRDSRQKMAATHLNLMRYSNLIHNGAAVSESRRLLQSILTTP